MEDGRSSGICALNGNSYCPGTMMPFAKMASGTSMCTSVRLAYAWWCSVRRSSPLPCVSVQCTCEYSFPLTVSCSDSALHSSKICASTRPCTTCPAKIVGVSSTMPSFAFFVNQPIAGRSRSCRSRS